MSIIAVIPARFNSTRLPGKPLIKILGKPMVQHVWERCIKIKVFDKVYVATDDLRIKKAVIGFGGKVIMTSKKCMSGTDRMAETARKVKGDIFINIQGDGPLFSKEEIVKCIEEVKKTKRFEIVTTVARINTRKQWLDKTLVKVVCDNNNNAMYFSRAPIPAVRGGTWPKDYALSHLSVYAFKRQNLFDYAKMSKGVLEEYEQLEQLRALQAGWRIRVVMAPYIHPGVDEPKDIAIVEKAMKKSIYKF